MEIERSATAPNAMSLRPKQGLFPQDMTGLRLIFVQHLGGRAIQHHGLSADEQAHLNAQVSVGLHLSFESRGVRHYTLLGEEGMRLYGLPIEYEQLRLLFPEIEWSDS